MSVLRKERFDLPDGIIYLDGNSLGPLPKGAIERANHVLGIEWGQDLIRAWNSAGWMALPQVVGDRIGHLIGAPKGSVATGDTLSIKVYQALAAALKMRPDRRVVLSDAGNFPTDLYMAQGLIGTLDQGYQLKTPAPEDVLSRIDESVAVVMLTHVDYRSGRLHDMDAITKAAHAAGAVMIWDLAHSAGAVPVDIAGSEAEFAVGCTYKYLNGGPGAPAYLFVAERHHEDARQPLSGWFGHRDPFAFETGFQPATGITKFLTGTPPILAVKALEAGLEVASQVAIEDIRAKSVALGEYFLARFETKLAGYGFTLASPLDPNLRGSQLSYAHPDGYAIMQALIANGVVGDFRAPDILRFGFAPLYVSFDDIDIAIDRLEIIMRQGTWRDPGYRVRSKVT